MAAATANDVEQGRAGASGSLVTRPQAARRFGITHDDVLPGNNDPRLPDPQLWHGHLERHVTPPQTEDLTPPKPHLRQQPSDVDPLFGCELGEPTYLIRGPCCNLLVTGARSLSERSDVPHQEPLAEGGVVCLLQHVEHERHRPGAPALASRSARLEQKHHQTVEI